MLSSTSNSNKSCENLRITSQSISPSVPASKSLRSPAPSLPFLTPPSSPLPGRRHPEALSGDIHWDKSLPCAIRGEASATPTWLPPPEWALDSREPVKRTPIQALFALPTPSPSPHQTRSYDHALSAPRFDEIKTQRYVSRIDSEFTASTSSNHSSSTTRKISPRPRICRFPHLTSSTPCVDGSHESPEREESSTTTYAIARQRAVCHSPTSQPPRGFSSAGSGRSHHTVPDLTLPDQHPLQFCQDSPFDDTTPLSQASPARQSFPFREPSGKEPLRSLNTSRWPSVLLHRPLQRSSRPSIREVSCATDRYIPGRDFGAKARENFLLTTPPSLLCNVEKRNRRQSSAVDPFGRNLRIAARTSKAPRTTLERSPPNNRANTHGPSLVPVDQVNRVASQGAIWNIGGPGMAVDGISSTSDGHGGRLASGTNAPMYTSAFLDQSEPSDGLELHERRLAAALDFDQANRVLVETSALQASASSPTSPRSPISLTSSPNVWQDSQWIGLEVGKFLDAPALRDDYYCSLLAYSETAKCLAVGLGAHVYLWSETRGVKTPDSLTSPFAGHVTSLSFSSTEGGHSILAIGRADGRITLWSPFDRDPRFDSDQPSPVSSVCFSPRSFKRASIRDPGIKASTEYLLIGDEAGHVYLYSIEWPNNLDRDLFNWHGSMTLLARIAIHTQQICGLAWSSDGEFFATSGNDNSLFLFETRKILRTSAGHATSSVQVRNGGGIASQPLPGQGSVISVTAGQESHHWLLNAAVKAVAFCPWQPSLLAAGGGSNDRCIHFYHALSGASLAIIDCAAQVTSLVWSQTRREIAATFGFAQPDHAFRVAVFSWPSCETIVKIPWWGEERALWAVAYPGGPNTGIGQTGSRNRRAREGKAWCARRTRDEGCLVIATSDASIKFHEVWSEGPRSASGGLGVGLGGTLGGSDILEALHGAEKEGSEVIR